MAKMPDMKVQVWMPDLQRMRSTAREACGCVRCAPRPLPTTIYEVEAAKGKPPQPKSCLAHTILAHLLQHAPCIDLVPVEDEEPGS